MLRLYNDLTQRVERFVPRQGQATVYVCGITPYDTTHLGHAFTYCSFDVLIRYLEWQGVAVQYVQNVTDVDDDILRKARESGEDWVALGNRWARRFVDDMEALNVRPPDHFPRASSVIPQMITIIEALLAQGYAYVRNGSVYYRSSRAGFGRLGHLPEDEWLRTAGERGNLPADPNKEAPLDFVLWQAHAPGEPAWPSPWGPGRPGWHIECSTLIEHFLGPTVDIHGGGSDLAFPHHESELAQAEAFGREGPFARYWLHTGMVCYQGAKMSKSLGNLVMACHLLEHYSADALRLYLAAHHYRASWCHDPAELPAALARARRWQAASTAQAGRSGRHLAQKCRDEFRVAMDDDLQTPQAIAAIDRLAEGTLRGEGGYTGQATLQELAGVLGLRLARVGPEPRVVAGWEAHKAHFRLPEGQLAGG